MTRLLISYRLNRIIKPKNEPDEFEYIEYESERNIGYATFKIIASVNKMPDDFEIISANKKFVSDSYFFCEDPDPRNCDNLSWKVECWCPLIEEIMTSGTGSINFLLKCKEKYSDTYYKMCINAKGDLNINTEISLDISFKFEKIVYREMGSTTNTAITTNNIKNLVKLIFDQPLNNHEKNLTKKEFTHKTHKLGLFAPEESEETKSEETKSENNKSENNKSENNKSENNKSDKLEEDKKVTLECDTSSYGIYGANFEYEFETLPNKMKVQNNQIEYESTLLQCKTKETNIGRYKLCSKENVCWCLLVDQIRSKGTGKIRIPLEYANSTNYNTGYYYNWLEITGNRKKEDTKLYLSIKTINNSINLSNKSREEKFIIL